MFQTTEAVVVPASLQPSRSHAGKRHMAWNSSALWAHTSPWVASISAPAPLIVGDAGCTNVILTESNAPENFREKVVVEGR